MKLFFFVLLFCTASLINGQSIQPGTYYPVKKDRGFVNELFQFNNDSSFQYYYSDCIGRGLGKGRYTVTSEDSLQLSFTDFNQEKFEDKFIVSRLPSDSVIIKLKIKSKHGYLFTEFWNICFPGTSVPAKSYPDSIVSIKRLKFDKPQIMRIECMGYANFDILLPVEYSFVSGVVNMNSDWLFMGGLVKSYKISSISKNEMALQMNDRVIITFQKLGKKEVTKWNKVMIEHERNNQPW